MPRPSVPNSFAKLAQQAKDAWKRPLRRQSDGTVWAWHFHHEGIAEPIYGTRDRLDYIRRSAIARIEDIGYNKPQGEIAVRLRRFRPIRGKIPESILHGGVGGQEELIAELHKQECPRCPYSLSSHYLFGGGDPK